MLIYLLSDAIFLWGMLQLKLACSLDSCEVKLVTLKFCCDHPDMSQIVTFRFITT